MRERILEFIEAEQITAAEFADKIGVQRSSVSHVLNGRNNPGFAFIQKILEAYPSINSRWLLTGSGKIYDKSPHESENKAIEHDLFSTVANTQPVNEQPQNKPPQTIDNTVHEQYKPEPAKEPLKAEQDKEVVRVLIFYNDHTFEDFRPAK